MRADWVDQHPSAAQALLMAVLEAQQWCDKMENKQEMCGIVGRRAWFNVPVADILPRLQGDYDYGDGRVVKNSPHIMKFWRDYASYPFKSHELWFLTENMRWGKLDAQARHQGADREGQPRGPLARRRRRRWACRRPTSRPRHPRQGDVLRRQGLRSRRSRRLPRQPPIKRVA